MTRNGLRGFTLIEVIIFIVVVATGLAGILLVSNTVVKSSADPMVRKQAVAVAESMLEEITLKEFKDPNGGTNGVSTCNGGTFITNESTANNRTLADDVCDYNGYASAAGGIRDIQGNLVSGLGGYSATVTVTDVTVSGQAMKEIRVQVAWSGDAVSLVGYRGNY